MSVRLILLASLAVSLLVSLSACGSKKKKEAEPQVYPAGTPEAAFVSMHQKYRAVDGPGVWALFSQEMKTGMAKRLESLRAQPKRLENEVGSVPADLATLSDADLYQLLLSGKRMQAKLAAGFPVVTGGAELEPGLYQVRYDDPRRGACTQVFIKEDGAWKAKRGPECSKPKK